VRAIESEDSLLELDQRADDNFLKGVKRRNTDRGSAGGRSGRVASKTASAGVRQCLPNIRPRSRAADLIDHRHIRDMLAAAILAAAKIGERDPATLSALTVAFSMRNPNLPPE
jgi:hypothetical protein